MTEEEKILKMLRRERDDFENQFWNELERLENQIKSAAENKEKDRLVKFKFKVESKTTIDAEEFICSARKNNLINLIVEKTDDKYLIKGEVPDIKLSEFSIDKYFQILGLIYYYCLYHFSVFKSYDIKLTK